MIKRFTDLEKPIRKALHHLQSSHMYDRNMFQTLNMVKDCLIPLEEAVLRLGKNNVNLLETEGIMKYIFLKLCKCKSELSEELIDALKAEFQKRRNVKLTSIMKMIKTLTVELKQPPNGLYQANF